MSTYLGDFNLSAVIRKMWNSNDSTGASVTRATNGTVQVYKDGGLTQSTTGVTDTEDFDGLTGVHLVAVDTSADGSFYSAGSDFEVVLSGATIDGVSVNVSLFSFSLLNRSPLRPATAGRTVVVDAAGLVDANVVKLGPTGSGTAQTARDIGASVLLSSGTATGQLDFASGVVKANIVQLLATAFTESGAGRLVAGIKKFFDVVTPASTMELITAVTTATNLTNAPVDSSGVTTILARLSAARAAYLDNLNVSGPVASSAEVTVIQNNTRVVRVVPDTFERPDSGSIAYRIELLLYDTQGNMEAPDSAPTISVVNQGGTSRDANLDSTTMSLVSTGRYRSTYTIDTNHALEELIFAFSVVEGGATRVYANPSLVVDTTAVDFTSADRVQLAAIFNKLPSKTYLTGTANSDGDVQFDEATGGFSASAKADINAEADTALGDYDAPTHAEMTAELATADDATLAAIAALNNLSQANVRTAVGLASANLDTQLSAINAKTTNLPSDPADQSAVEAAILAAWTTALTESYNADGSPPTPAQALFVIMQTLTEFAISGTTLTVKKLDGSTTAFTLTLDSATTPTSATRAT